MVPCASGLLMSALALALVITDVYNDRINYVAEHAILGGIVSILFFTMCSYGCEIVNWVLLAAIPIIILVKWSFSTEIADEDNECDECKKSKKTCGCSDETEEISKPKRKLGCPAKGGLTLGDTCGISRFT